MKATDNLWSTEETALLFSFITGLIRLVAIIATFLLWSGLVALMMLGLWTGLVSWGDIGLWYRASGVFSVTPVLLTVLSWRVIEKAISAYLLHFAQVHTLPQIG